MTYYMQMTSDQDFLCLYEDETILYRAPLQHIGDVAILSAMKEISQNTGIAMIGDTWNLPLG